MKSFAVSLIVALTIPMAGCFYLKTGHCDGDNCPTQIDDEGGGSPFPPCEAGADSTD